MPFCPPLVACIPVVLSYSQLPCRSSNASSSKPWPTWLLLLDCPSIYPRLPVCLPLLLISQSSTSRSIHSLLHFFNKLWLKIHHMLGSILVSWGIWKWTTDGLFDTMNDVHQVQQALIKQHGERNGPSQHTGCYWTTELGSVTQCNGPCKAPWRSSCLTQLKMCRGWGF